MHHRLALGVNLCVAALLTVCPPGVEGRSGQEQSDSVAPLAEPAAIDLGTLNIHPLSAPLASGGVSAGPGPLSQAVGAGDAFLDIAPQIVNQNTTAAFVVLGANFTPGENVAFYFNGSLFLTHAADPNGRLIVSVSTPAGFGYRTIEEIGLTSGKRTGGVVQVAATGPYLPGVVVASHAINPTGSSTFLMYGAGYPPSSSVTVYRNGVSIGTATTDNDGIFGFTRTIAVTADTSAVYSADTGTPGSMAGRSIEERSDAGIPPAGDQNVARLFVDHAVFQSGTTSVVSYAGEGFQPGEVVTLSGVLAGTLNADGNGAVDSFATFSSGFAAGAYSFTLTGNASGRVARASVLLNANVTNVRGMIVSPAIVAPGFVTVRLDGLTPNDTGTAFFDNVMGGTFTTSPGGSLLFTVTTPPSGFVHAVSWVGSGGGDTQAAAFLLVLPTLAESFDTFTAPALPAGWTTATTGAGIAWTTVTTSPVDTAPNAAFGPESGNVGLTTLTSPIIAVPVGGGSQVRFRNLYNLETNFDGMVLDISIGGGLYTDILAAGGSFVSGGYDHTLNGMFMNPLSGRLAWTGLSGGTSASPAYITTLVNLPDAAIGQDIRLRWIVGSDSGTVATGQAGVRIDTITLDRPPTVVTGAASAITSNGATLNGTVNPNGTMTTAKIEYGLTTSYGAATPLLTLGASGAAQPITRGRITNLTCNTQYHFRAVAMNTNGTTTGSDASFTWAAAGCPFTDGPLTPAITVIKASHVLELRIRIDAICLSVGCGPNAWTDTLTAGTTPVRAVHITEMRGALEAAYIKKGVMPLPSYSDPDLQDGTPIKAAHIMELRAAVTNIE